MLNEFVTVLEQSLKKSRFSASISMLRNWLSGCAPGMPEQLLAACSPNMRPHVAILMRDLLSRYPSTLLGCPVLLQSAPEAELDSPLPPAMQLPFPRPQNSMPCTELHFVGWLPATALLPVPFPFRPELYNNQISWRTPTAVVALFRSHPGVWDMEALEVPCMWWGELFMQTHGNTRFEGKALMPYPDALEAARAMQAGANGASLPAVNHFSHDVSRMHEQGIQFAEACRTHFLD